MTSLVCLVKGHSIGADELGYVKCPWCELQYCYDRHRYVNARAVGGWRVCLHGAACTERRLHKGRNDTKLYCLEQLKKQLEG